MRTTLSRFAFAHGILLLLVRTMAAAFGETAVTVRAPADTAIRLQQAAGTGTAIHPLMTQLHVVSVHVRDHAAYDAVFLLLRDVLGLPWLYGSPSKPEQKGRTLYAGFSVGNAYLEPCGPYKGDDPYPDDAPARFFGLTFHTVMPVAAVAEAIEHRGLEHGGVIPFSSTAPKQEPTRFLVVRNAELAGGRRAVSIWKPGDASQSSDFSMLQKRLLAAEGGSLGVRRLDEVWLGGADARGRDYWARLLSPLQSENLVYRIGPGPALRLIDEGPRDVRAVVLKVASLERAKAFLRSRQLLGAGTADSAELDPASIHGLRIILRE